MTSRFSKERECLPILCHSIPSFSGYLLACEPTTMQYLNALICFFWGFEEYLSCTFFISLKLKLVTNYRLLEKWRNERKIGAILTSNMTTRFTCPNFAHSSLRSRWYSRSIAGLVSNSSGLKSRFNTTTFSFLDRSPLSLSGRQSNNLRKKFVV